MGICINYHNCGYGTYDSCCKDYIQDSCKHLRNHFEKDRLPNYQLKVKSSEDDTEYKMGDMGLLRCLK